MKTHWIALILMSLALGMFADTPKAAPAPAKPGDDTVGRVNATVLTRKNLDIQVAILLEQGKRMGHEFTDKDKAMVEQKAMNNLIEMEIAWQEAQKEGIKADPKETDKKVAAFKSQFKTPDEFQAFLKEMAISEDKLKEDTAKEICIYALMDKWASAAVPVTETELKAYYDAHTDQFKHGERVRAAHILVSVKEGATADEKAAAKKKAEAVLAQLKGGADFAKLAAEKSDDPGSKGQGGELGFFRKGQMVKEFEDAAFALKPGERSGVVESKFGFHIIKAEAHEGEGTVPYEEGKARLKPFMDKQRQREIVQHKIDELKKTAKIESYLAPPPAAEAPAKPAAPPAGSGSHKPSH